MISKILIILISVWIAAGDVDKDEHPDLKCYHCQGDGDNACLDLKKDARIMPCKNWKYLANEDYPQDFYPQTDNEQISISRYAKDFGYQCLKLTIHHNKRYTFMGCVYKKYEADQACTGKEGESVICDMCTTDLCNSSYMILPSFRLLVVVLLFGKLL